MQTVSAPTVVIIAAGEGTRMRSALPKVLHPLCGRPLILWPVTAALEAGAGKVVVVDNPKRRLEDWLPEGVEVAEQPEPNGTGGGGAAGRGPGGAPPPPGGGNRGPPPVTAPGGHGAVG